MSKIIGTTYNATNLRALDLETQTSVNLGSRKYVVISEPYKKAFQKPRNEFLCMFPLMWTAEQVWINVLDPVTDRTYAVLFIPARVKGTPGVQDAPKPKKPADFIQRAREIADELNAMAKADPDFGKKCGVAFFAMQRKADDKGFFGAAFVGGGKKNIIDGMVAATDDVKNTDVADVLSKAGQRATINSFFNQVIKK